MAAMENEKWGAVWRDSKKAGEFLVFVDNEFPTSSS